MDEISVATIRAAYVTAREMGWLGMGLCFGTAERVLQEATGRSLQECRDAYVEARYDGELDDLFVR